MNIFTNIASQDGGQCFTIYRESVNSTSPPETGQCIRRGLFGLLIRVEDGHGGVVVGGVDLDLDRNNIVQ